MEQGLTHLVSQPALLHSIRPSPRSISLLVIISPQSHSYNVDGRGISWLNNTDVGNPYLHCFFHWYFRGVSWENGCLRFRTQLLRFKFILFCHFRALERWAKWWAILTSDCPLWEGSKSGKWVARFGHGPDGGFSTKFGPKYKFFLRPFGLD